MSLFRLRGLFYCPFDCIHWIVCLVGIFFLFYACALKNNIGCTEKKTSTSWLLLTGHPPWLLWRESVGSRDHPPADHAGVHDRLLARPCDPCCSGEYMHQIHPPLHLRFAPRDRLHDPPAGMEPIRSSIYSSECVSAYILSLGALGFLHNPLKSRGLELGLIYLFIHSLFLLSLHFDELLFFNF